MRISFYFDPSCPWCWMTSRWITEVQQYRELQITWKPFSLEIKNTGIDVPAQYRPGMRLGLRALRVIEAAKLENIADMDSIGRFYSVLGTQIHNDGLGAAASLAQAIKAANWPEELHYHENSEEFDAQVKASMQEAIDICGTEDVGVPILVLTDNDPIAFFGPILTPTPRGEEAATLWDSFTTLATNRSFYEMKKHQSRKPDFS